jgi:hypothetical protein
VEPLSLVRAPQNVLEYGSLHCPDVALEYLLEDRLHVAAEVLEKMVWDEVSRSLYPFLLELRDLLVPDGVLRVYILQVAVRADLHLPHQVLRPDLVVFELAPVFQKRQREVIDSLHCFSFLFSLPLRVLSANLLLRCILQRHGSVEKAVLLVLSRSLLLGSAGVFLYRLDGVLGGLQVSYQVR